MPGKVADVILIIALLALPMLGIIQACGGNGPIAPGRPVDTPEDDDEPVLPGDNHAPTAVLSVVGPEEGATPFTVHLDGSGSFDPDGDPLEYLWIFSDGGSATESIVEHEFVSSGRYDVTLVVTDPHDASDDEGPLTLYSWGLANSPWPKFAHDERNSGVAQFEGPMMDLENADDGGAWSRYWRSGIQNALIEGICVGYDGTVIYAQGDYLRARTSDGAYLWDLPVDSVINTWPAILHDGSIIIGTGTGWVYRTGADGSIIWSINIADELNLTVFGRSAITVDNNGIIYTAYKFEDRQIHDAASDAVLLAISQDGDLVWSAEFKHMAQISPCIGAMNQNRLVPAITPDGNILINGGGNRGTGRLYSSDGNLIVECDYLSYFGGPDWGITIGPPSVGEDSTFVFSHGNLPLFDSDGILIDELTEDNSSNALRPWLSSVGAASPVWGSQGITQLQELDSVPDSLYLATSMFNGLLVNYHVIEGQNILYSYSQYPSRYAAGVTEDSTGIMYVAAGKIFAVSPIQFQTEPPYGPVRYSLWSYGKNNHNLSQPVIGDDRWLYIACGSDILAVGD